MKILFLKMCEEERNGSSFRNSSMLTNLQKSNPEKFQRYYMIASSLKFDWKIKEQAK